MESQKDKDIDKKIIIIVTLLFLCVIIAAATVLFMSGAFGRSRGADEGDGSNHDSTDGEYANVPADWNAETHHKKKIDSRINARLSTTTTTISTTTTWTTTTSTLSGTPILLCTMGIKTNKHMPYVPDGLCDMLVYHGGIQGNGAFYNDHSGVNEFERYCATAKAAKRTMYGLDVMESQRDSTYSRLSTEKAKKRLRAVFESNVRHYGTLTTTLHRNTPKQYVQGVISLLTSFRQLQVNFSNGTEETPSYIFYGAAPLYEGNYDNDTAMRDNFDEVMKKVNPDIVLFRTTYTLMARSYSGCKVTGDSVWESPSGKDQPSFEDSLTFRSRVTLPPGVRQLLSFSACGRWNYRTSGLSLSSGLGQWCTGTSTSRIFERACRGGAFYSDYQSTGRDNVRLLEYRLRSDRLEMFVYDTAETIRTKMCRASVQHSYLGGWALFEAECSDISNVCNDPTYRDGYATIRRVKDLMNTTFSKC